jgi:hypothetical protein
MLTYVRTGREVANGRRQWVVVRPAGERQRAKAMTTPSAAPAGPDVR